MCLVCVCVECSRNFVTISCIQAHKHGSTVAGVLCGSCIVFFCFFFRGYPLSFKTNATSTTAEVLRLLRIAKLIESRCKKIIVLLGAGASTAESWHAQNP